MVALLVALGAGLLVLAESQASDIADRSNPQGFLSLSGVDASKTSLDDYSKLVIPMPNVNRMKHGNGQDMLSYHSNPAEYRPAVGDTQHLDTNVDYGERIIANMRERSFLTLQGKPEIVDKEEEKAVQKMLANSNTPPTSLCAITVGLLSLVAVIGFRIRRGFQPATVLASSSALGSDMSSNMAQGLADSIMEMESQASNPNLAAASEKRPPSKEKSRIVDSGKLSGQNSHTDDEDVAEALQQLKDDEGVAEALQQLKEAQADRDDLLAISRQLSNITRKLEDRTSLPEDHAVKFFINGDSVPETALDWLEEVITEERGKVQIFIVVGRRAIAGEQEEEDTSLPTEIDSAGDEDSSLKKFFELGVHEDDVQVVPAQTSMKQAADVVLLVLYGRHAGSLNYILSNDNELFGEVRAKEMPGQRTLWLKFSEFEDHSDAFFYEYMGIRDGRFGETTSRSSDSS
jgi:hypothetical protein